MAKEPEIKSMESWIWKAACSIHGAVDAPKYKDFILPLIFVKRLCDVFDDEVNRIAKDIGSRAKAFKLVEHDKKLVRFYIPLTPKNIDEPVWSVIRKLSDKIGENLTTYLRAIAKENPKLSGIIDRIDFNAATHGVKDIDDDRLSNLIEEISKKRLGLNDVEPDIIGRSYEYLIRKFAEGSGQSAGEFYTPREVGLIMAKIMDPEPGMKIYDPCCGSASLLIKCEFALNKKMMAQGEDKFLPLKLYGQEYIPQTWAMANMNMIIHDMEGQIEIGDTFRNPKFRESNRLMAFDRVVANPMWNQTMFTEIDYDADAFGRFPNGAGYPGSKADWGWMQHILASLKDDGRATVIFSSASATRGSGNGNRVNKEKNIRKYFLCKDFIESVILLPENLFYNTPNSGLIFVLNKAKTYKNKILMIDVSEYYKRGRSKNILSEEGLSLISDSFFNWKEIPGVAVIVDKKMIEIQENDYNLLPSRYIHRPLQQDWEIQIYTEFENAKREFSRKIIFDFLAKFFNVAKKQTGVISELDLVKDKSKWKLCRLDELLINSSLTYKDRESTDPIEVLSLTKNKGLIIQSERFGHSVAINNLTNYKFVKTGWLVYNPMVIWEGAIHVLYEPACGVVSPAYEVWYSKGIDFRYLDYILKTPVILDEYRRLSSGGVKRRRIVSTIDFSSIKIPVPIGNLYDNLCRSLDSLSRNLSGTLDNLLNSTIKSLE